MRRGFRTSMIIISIIVIVIDRWSKLFFLHYLSARETLPIIPGFLHFTLTKNPGVTFGLFPGNTWIPSLITIAALIFGIWWYVFKADDILTKFILSLIIGGGAGNLIDRLQYGYVIDFIDVRGIWPFIFNFADSCVVVGFSLLILKVILEEKRRAKNA